MGPETSNPHRGLNPSLFGTPTSEPQGSEIPRGPASQMMGAPAQEPRRAVPYPPIDIKGIESQILSLKTAISQMEKRTETIAFKMEELARNVHTRLERFSQAILRFEDAQGKSNAETSQRLATVFAKVNERKISDTKIQELVDRHNTIVRNFENRMLNMQRLVSEQEMSLHNAQAALEEARNEIARLKR